MSLKDFGILGENNTVNKDVKKVYEGASFNNKEPDYSYVPEENRTGSFLTLNAIDEMNQAEANRYNVSKPEYNPENMASQMGYGSPGNKADAYKDKYNAEVESNKWDIMNLRGESMTEEGITSMDTGENFVKEVDGRKVGTVHGQHVKHDSGLDIYWDTRVDRWVTAEEFQSNTQTLYDAKGGKEGFEERNLTNVESPFKGLTGEELDGSPYASAKVEIVDEDGNTEIVEEPVIVDDTEDGEWESDTGVGGGIKSTSGDYTPEFEFEYKALPSMDRDMFLEDASDITDAMVKMAEANAELQKKGIDDIKQQRAIEFDYLATKQQYALAQMMSKQNIPASMRGQQFNQLMLNMFVESSAINTELDMQKLDIDNEMAQYKIAMHQQNYELADKMYNDAMEKAQITYDITGEYIPPELDFMYAELDNYATMMEDNEVGSPQYEEAKLNYDQFSEKVEALGFSADERRGYKARKDAYAEYMNEFDMYLQNYEFTANQKAIATREDTYNAVLEMRNAGVWNNDGNLDASVIYDIIERYPNMDMNMVFYGVDFNAFGIEPPEGYELTGVGEGISGSLIGGETG